MLTVKCTSCCGGKNDSTLLPKQVCEFSATIFFMTYSDKKETSSQVQDGLNCSFVVCGFPSCAALSSLSPNTQRCFRSGELQTLNCPE